MQHTEEVLGEPGAPHPRSAPGGCLDGDTSRGTKLRLCEQFETKITAIQHCCVGLLSVDPKLRTRRCTPMAAEELHLFARGVRWLVGLLPSCVVVGYRRARVCCQITFLRAKKMIHLLIPHKQKNMTVCLGAEPGVS